MLFCLRCVGVLTLSSERILTLFAMRIDIVIHADVLCPWSFLEKRSIETAIYRYKTRNPGIEFEVVWKPYLLYPTLRRGMWLYAPTRTGVALVSSPCLV